MLRLSVDILWSTRLVLKRIIEYDLNNIDDIYLSNISSVNLDILIEFAEKCKWISTKDSHILINSRAYEIISKETFMEQAKEMLKDYIINTNPAWSKRIPYGRKEAFVFMNKDEQACFCEAGLMNEPPNDIEIKWWDDIANCVRNIDDQRKIEIGRRGELYTVLYEKKRTGIYPELISLDSNMAGYDIISCVSKDNKSKLLIEVKCSDMSINIADFYVTENEWHTACNSPNYLFYLWCLYDGKKLLAIINPSTLLPYIPTNNNTGNWKIVRIPFNSFIQMFSEIV